MKGFVEKLIGRLEELIDQYGKQSLAYNDINKIYEFVGREQTAGLILEIVNELAAEYESNLSESLTSWIPCSEKQPNKDGYYLVTTSDGEIDVREYDYSKGWGWDGFERIIAWLPLPEPFRTEKAEWKDKVMNHFTKVD